MEGPEFKFHYCTKKEKKKMEHIRETVYRRQEMRQHNLRTRRIKA
jgi:hypothetical protein